MLLYIFMVYFFLLLSDILLYPYVTIYFSINVWFLIIFSLFGYGGSVRVEDSDLQSLLWYGGALLGTSSTLSCGIWDLVP